MSCHDIVSARDRESNQAQIKPPVIRATLMTESVESDFVTQSSLFLGSYLIPVHIDIRFHYQN